MSEELYFNDELRKCLNAAGLSDCGENDAWDYWYQRVHKAHDQAVDRVTEAQRAENAKLRKLLHRLLVEYRYLRVRPRKMYLQHEARMRAIEEEMRELGVEVDE